MNLILYEKIKANNNMITTSEFMGLGFSKQSLTNYVKDGTLERIRHGVYILTDSIHDDLYTLTLRSENIILSHESAAFLNGLSERTPFQHSVTIPTGASLPNSLLGECKSFYIKGDLYNVGCRDCKTTFGNSVKIYNAERTICDILRSRSRLDEEMVIQIMRKYIESKEKNINQLYDYALLFKVDKKLKQYLEVLL